MCCLFGGNVTITRLGILVQGTAEQAKGEFATWFLQWDYARVTGNRGVSAAPVPLSCEDR